MKDFRILSLILLTSAEAWLTPVVVQRRRPTGLSAGKNSKVKADADKEKADDKFQNESKLWDSVKSKLPFRKPVEEEIKDVPQDEEGLLASFFKRRKDQQSAQSNTNANSTKDNLKQAEKSKKDRIEAEQKQANQRRIETEKKKVESEKIRQTQQLQTKQPNEESIPQKESTLIAKIQSFFVSTNATEAIKNATALQEKILSPIFSVQKFFAKKERNNNTEEWVTVFPKTRIMPGGIVPIVIAGLDLLVIASKDGRRLYCIANQCPHLGTPLETGQLVRLPVVENNNNNNNNIIRQASEKSPSQQLLAGTLNGPWSENDVSSLLQQDGCEDCIVCPLHRTAFALSSGNVRGEWCPYPPVIGKLMGLTRQPVSAAVFDVRARGKNVQVRINMPLL
jgi:nitrite reductase/ring-hydroxylating ferredoxin subunit